MKNEILCFLPNSDEPVTAKRLTAQIFPPYSASKSAEVSKILEVLLSEGKVANCRIPGVNNIGWYSLNNLNNSRIDIHTISRTLQSLKNNGNDISFYLKRQVLKCICNALYPITHTQILKNLDYLNIIFTPGMAISYLQELEIENKIKKIRLEPDILPAWRIFDPLLDTAIKTATNTYTYKSKALEKGFCLSDDHNTLYISIFSISSNAYANLKELITKLTFDFVIVDFPNNRKKIHLNDKQAFILSQDKSGKHLSYLEKFLKKFTSTPGHLELAQKFVSSRRGEHIDFEVLSEISDEVAIIFSNFKGTLSLSGIKKLSDRAAQALSKLKDRLDLYRLEELSDSPGNVKLAQGLARQETLCLPNLVTISSKVAAALACNKGRLELHGIQSISDEVADQLSRCTGDLEMRALKELNDSAGHIKFAEKLARQETLCLPNLVTISSKVAAALACNKGRVELDGIQNISDEAAEQLSRCTGDLVMPFIDGLSNTKAHVKLGVKLLKYYYDDNSDVNQDQYNGEGNSICHVSRIFKKITPALLKNSFISNLNISLQNSIIDDKLADALCDHEGKIELIGLEELTDSESHISLSRRIGNQETVYLKKLKKLSFFSADALSDVLELYLDGLHQIDEELSSVLSRNIGILSLNGITDLSDDSALALSHHTGFLFLNGLSSLTDSRGHLHLAKKLSRQDSIELKNLKSISSEAADLFCNCPGDILLPYKILGKSPEHLQLRIKISKQSFLLP